MTTLLTTKELKDHIHNECVKLKTVAQKEGIYSELGVYFSNGTPLNIEGTYAYSDEIGYHYASTEKGKINLHKITNDIFEISYWICADYIFTMSFEYATKHRKKNQDFRRILFAKELELLGLIGENFRKRGKIEIDEILKTAPYNDKVK